MSWDGWERPGESLQPCKFCLKFDSAIECERGRNEGGGGPRARALEVDLLPFSPQLNLSVSKRSYAQECLGTMGPRERAH